MSKNVLGLMSQIYLTFNNVPIFNGTLVKSSCKLIVPVGSATTYTAANYWKDFTQISELDFFDNLKIDTSNRFKISVKGKSIVVKDVDLHDNIKIFNTQGMQLHSIISTENEVSIPLYNTGVYIVKIDNFARKIRIE